MLPVDDAILNRVRERPGVQQSDIVRAMIAEWSPAHVRGRIKVLEARGALRTGRDGGNRILVYPGEAIAA